MNDSITETFQKEIGRIIDIQKSIIGHCKEDAFDFQPTCILQVKEINELNTILTNYRRILNYLVEGQND